MSSHRHEVFPYQMRSCRVDLRSVDQTRKRLLIRDPPAIEPLEMTPLAARAHHSKADSPEQPEQTDNRDVQRTVQHPVDLLVQLARCPIHAETRSQDSKVQSWVVVVNICDTTHGDERNVVQKPADNRVQTRVVNMVNIGRLEVVVTTLPAYEIPGDVKGEDTERGRGAPVDERVTEEEVLDD